MRSVQSRREWMHGVLLATAAVAVLPVSAQTPWTPRFFSAEQNQALVAIGERIVPGSEAAQCNRLIDLFMTLEEEKHRNALLQAIAEFDGKARNQFQKPFQALASEQKDALLTEASAHSAPDSAFAVIKEWVADSYWSSREGMLELGWDKRMSWLNYPACPH